MKEYMKQYYKDTKEYTETGKLEIERKKKLKEFIGKKKKISSTALRDFVINELGYSRYRAAYWEKKYPNLNIYWVDPVGLDLFESMTLEQSYALMNKNDTTT